MNTEIVNVSTEQSQQITKRVDTYADGITGLKPHSPEWVAKRQELAQIGAEDIYNTGEASSRLLSKTMKDMKDTGSGAKVSTTLVELRGHLQELDPQHAKSLNGVLTRFMPFGNRIERYFQQYEKAGEQIDKVVTSLYHGKDELTRDNAAIELERGNMYDAMGRLREHIEVARQLDEQLSAEIEEVRKTDPDHAKQLEQDMLFPARQRQHDLMTHLAVTAQGYLALDVIAHNNTELIKGVDRATTTTRAALTTAVMVQSALQSQAQVKEQIDGINNATNSLIQHTSKTVKDQTGEIAKQSMSSGVSIDTLKKSFTEVFAAMDSFEQHKANAISAMGNQIKVLETELTTLSKNRGELSVAGPINALEAGVTVSAAEQTATANGDATTAAAEALAAEVAEASASETAKVKAAGPETDDEDVIEVAEADVEIVEEAS